MRIQNLKQGRAEKAVSCLLAAFLSATVVLTAYIGALISTEQVASAATIISAPADMSAQAMFDDMLATNQEMCEEGFVLLKNYNNFLPMQKAGGAKRKVTIFGKNSEAYSYFGFGSSDNGTVGYWPDGTMADSKPMQTEIWKAFQDSVTFEPNQTMIDFYHSAARSGPLRLNGDLHASIDNYRFGLNVGETPIEKYTATEKSTFANYNEAAIVVLTRIAGEGSDVPKTSLKSWSGYSNANKLDSARQWDDHYLQLDKNEVDMLQLVMTNFDNVIILLNTNTQLEIGFLDDYNNYLYTDNNYCTTEPQKIAAMNKIKAAMYIGFPGTAGAKAIPRVLDGSANPSGHLADTWMRDFKNDPTWQNQGYGQNQDNIRYGDYFVHYEEDIYLGYRYYETRYITEGGDSPITGYPLHGTSTTDWASWYDANVVYPFGYGLSYTDFTWTTDSITSSTGTTALDKDGSVTATVTVKNTGLVAGKDVVQLYYNAPYIQGGIEKAHVILGGFAKTKLLAPNEEQTITISLDVSEMKSYDWADQNGNGFEGYELDAGNYNIVIARDAHDAAELPTSFTQTFTVGAGFRYEVDTTTGNPVGNLFDEVSGTGKVNDRTSFKGVGTYFSRADFANTYPTASETKKTGLQQRKQVYTINEAYDEGKPWYSDVEYTQASVPGTAEINKIKLWHLRGRNLNDPLWEKLLDQLTAKEMADLIGTCVYYTIAIPSIDKPFTKENDGPLGSRWCVSIQWQSAPVSAQTFNTDLTYRQGRLLGNATHYPVNQDSGGTYGPGLETHRSPFGGRNMEYYSEDPVLGGEMCAPFMEGAWAVGSYQLIKHFVLNNCETERNSISTWASEQAIREVYCKAYEIVVKAGHCQGFMSAVSYIGDMPCTTSYPLLTGLLRNEWGFEGLVISDMLTQDVELAIRAGNDLMLTGNAMNQPRVTAQWLTTTQLACIRKAAKNILYVVANSHKMNGYGGNALDDLEYIGSSSLYAVKDVTNDTTVGTAAFKSGDYNPIKYTLNGGALPTGMTLNDDGTITGAPTETGTFIFTAKASEDVPATVAFPYNPVSKTFKLTVFDKSNLPNQIIYEENDLGVIPYGFEYSKSVASAVVFDEDGKISADITYKLEDGQKLPAGLKLENGVISGVTYEESGSFFFTIVAEYPGKTAKKADIICTIKAYLIDYQAKELTSALVGKSTVIDIGDANSNSDAAITYALKSTSKLPEGLSLSPEGQIFGVPTRAYNNHSFTVIAVSQNAKPVEVDYRLTVIGLVFDDAVFDGLYLGKAYSFKLQAAHNDGTEYNIDYELKSSSSLPNGFKLLADGTLFGVTEDLGELSFVVVAKANGEIISEATVTMHISDIYEDEPDGEDGLPIAEQPEDTGCKSAAASIGAILPIVFLAFVLLKQKKS
ncbi:MAG: glycoside hydrolase family 3 C-terminal domain-containing protein [Clostridiales bacterium]|jgi:beta-glucosidase|nr:glycoside hydrolase family 3 C-terminal domain-containing protein [Clostridiales bacterium]